MKTTLKPEKIYMYGKHALMEALQSMPQAVKKVFLADTEKDTALQNLLNQRHIPVAPLKGEIPRHLSDAAHQGVIALIDQSSMLVSLETVLAAIDPSTPPCFVLLDELQDPHNVGAIIRSAAAFGASAVLMPEHNQAPITGAVIKASAGMAFRIPLVQIGNVNNTIRILKEKGFWVYGLAMDGEKNVAQESFDKSTLFIIGNEGEGIRAKTLELCDIKLHIPMHPKCESLNAAVSAAIVLYAWSTQHTISLK